MKINKLISPKFLLDTIPNTNFKTDQDNYEL